MMQNYAWLLLLVLPLLGFAACGALGRRMPRSFTSWIGCGVVGAAFVVAVVVFFQIRSEAPRAQFHDLTYYRWVDAGTFHLTFGFLIDPLTSVMLLIVTGVGFLIHVYSVGYMAGDPNYSRYFSYLNLFIFSMLLLVLADNYLILTIGWGLVGLSSYLLIGFWFERRSAVEAARKAFVMNVIGDVGMMIAAYLLFVHFGTLNYDGVFSKAQFMRPDTGILNIICFMLLIGAVAKSAQIPLYTWLPDAMEGPTPVSALIHAATMVTAGVYLIARSHVLFQLAPTALASVAIIGAVGGIYAASIGLVQVDIKRVLAYSTMSQIAYMFLACGVGAYSVGIFHLMTHAFFKALLFMAAGNVIHALAGEQDMRLMGGLRGKLRWSYWLMLVGCLAISGIPPLAGFFSKDDILGRVLAAGNWHIVLWVLGVIAAGMTAFYMFRLFYLTFHGTYNGPREVYEHAHEAPRVMVVPAAILGVLSIIGGWIQIPAVSNSFDDFLQPVFTRYAAAHAGLAPLATNWLAMGVALAAALLGIDLAYSMYGGPVRRPYPGLRPLYLLLFNKYYVDEIYDEIVVVPVRNGARFLYNIVDRETIDGLVNGVAAATRRVSLGLSPIQSGYVRAYALSIFVGVVLVALVPMVFGTVVK
jgi:NADH-quinone oxidoreductase subunit L